MEKNNKKALTLFTRDMNNINSFGVLGWKLCENKNLQNPTTRLVWKNSREENPNQNYRNFHGKMKSSNFVFRWLQRTI
jgi:hypothetical protein